MPALAHEVATFVLTELSVSAPSSGPVRLPRILRRDGSDRPAGS